MDAEAPGTRGAVADERRVAQHRAVERDDRRQTFDMEFVQSAAGPLDGLHTVGAGDDQLGQHRVELTADHRAGLHAGVQPHAGAAGGVVAVHRPRCRQEAAAGVLTVDPELD